MVDGAKHVRIFGETIQVHARIHTINDFSAHADREELLAWHGAVGAPRTFLVHGEEEVMQEFATVLPNTQVELPRLGDQNEL
jgi:metallo-beta-lactamase family protein